jgi:hypothetical protein
MGDIPVSELEGFDVQEVEDAPLLTRVERRLHEDLFPAGGGLLVRTRTRADTGSWFGKSRVWACCVDDELVLFAAGKKPFVERIPFSELGGSFYNHVTGEVAFSPAADAFTRSIRVPPVEGRRLLEELVSGGRRDA